MCLCFNCCPVIYNGESLCLELAGKVIGGGGEWAIAVQNTEKPSVGNLLRW